MKVDNIVINNFTHKPGEANPNCGGIYRFYDKNGNVISSGDIITNYISDSETENFLIKGYSVWYGASNYMPIYAFYTGYSDSCIPVNSYIAVSHVYDGSTYLKIKFKKPIEMSKIECNISANDTISVAGTTGKGADITINYTTGESKTYTLFNESYEINHIFTINLPQHQIGINQMIKTTVDSRINNISKVNGFYVNCDIPEDTDMKFILSVDGINYVKYDTVSSSWININANANDIMNSGMSKSELESITKTELDQLINYDTFHNFDFAVSMVTNQGYCTPVLFSISVSYIEVSE